MDHNLRCGPFAFIIKDMYVYTASNKMPSALWNLDDTPPFADFSPYAESGIQFTGAHRKSIPLVSGANFSSTFLKDNVGKFTNSPYVQGNEKKSFTIETWLYIISPTPGTQQRVLSTSGFFDGISTDGTKVKFATEYVAQGQAACVYETIRPRSLHVVGVHYPEKNELWINGELVAETQVTDAQQSAQFVSGGPDLIAGDTTGTQAVAMNGVAFYSRGLTENEIISNFESGRTASPAESVPDPYGGIEYDTCVENADWYATQTWNSIGDWSQGDFAGTDILEDQLVPIVTSGITQASSWTGNFNLDQSSTSLAYGVWAVWDGAVQSVEASLDGTSWLTLSNGANFLNVTSAFTTTDQSMFIRVNFAGGSTTYNEHLNSIEVTALKSGTGQSNIYRTVTYNSSSSMGASIRHLNDVMELDNNTGTRFAGQTVTFGADSQPTPDTLRTVEALLRVNEGGSLTNTLAGISATYVNGVSAASVGTGEWGLYHWTTSSDQAAPGFALGGGITLRHVALYKTVLTQAEITSINRQYFGREYLPCDISETISVTASAQDPKIYLYDWEIVQSS